MKKPFSWFSDLAKILGVPVWVIYLVAILTGVILLSWIGIGPAVEIPVLSAPRVTPTDDYVAALSRATAKGKEKPFLIFVTMDNCAPCARLEIHIKKLAARNYEFASVNYSTDPGRARRVVFGEKVTSLQAMSQLTLPQLILWLPLKGGQWQKWRLVNPPVTR